MSNLASALLTPKGVVLVGASTNPEKNTGRPQRFLSSHGYAGAVYPVNPGRDEVQGVPSVAHISEIDGPCDHAFIMVPSAYVPDAIRDCGKLGIKLATVYSDGFAEIGSEGKQRQDEMVKMANDHGVRILGPNSMGVISPSNGLMLSVNAVLEAPDLPAGRFGLISQSGTILGTMLSRGAARGIGFSRLVSVGNEADIGVGELVDILVEDVETDAILLFLESLRDAASLATASRRAFDAGKPIIAYKLGRSAAGQAVAMSHSGALAGEDSAVDAFFRANGILRVETLETLFEMPPLLMGHEPATSRRVCVMTTTGGGASTVVDRLGAVGLDIIPAPAKVHQRLKEFDLTIGTGPLVDLTMAGTRPGVYGAVLEEIIKSSVCDAVVCVVGSSAQFHPELAVAPIVEVGANRKKPVAAFMVPQADESLRILAEAGIAAFRTPESCVDALKAFFDWRQPQLNQVPPSSGRKMERVRRTLDEAESLEFFRNIGIPVARHQIINAGETSTELSYPLAVKALSSKLPHKTEVGAVKLGIKDDAALISAITEITENVGRCVPQISLERFLVEEMASGVGEALVGYREDPQVGGVVVLAPGGVTAELYGDSAVRIAPINIETAHDMIDEVIGLAPIRGYRNLPKGDINALANALVCLSNLAVRPDRPTEAEINPLIVCAHDDGVVAVDGLVVFG